MIKEAMLIGRNEYKILEGEFVIGRAKNDSSSNIKINEHGNIFISSNHCKIYNDGEKLEIIDVGSRNGTYVNEEKIMPGERVILKNQDKLKLSGACELEVKIIEEENGRTKI